MLDQSINRAAATEQQQPSHDIENVRNTERNDGAEEDVIAPGGIRALDDQRLHGAKRECNECRADGVDHGVEQTHCKITTSEELLVVPLGELIERAVQLGGVEACIDEEQGWGDDKHDDDGGKHCDQR